MSLGTAAPGVPRICVPHRKFVHLDAYTCQTICCLYKNRKSELENVIIIIIIIIIIVIIILSPRAQRRRQEN